MATKLGYQKGEVAALHSLGFYYRVKANDFMAFKQLNDALEISKTMKDTTLQCVSLAEIAVLSATRNLLPQARNYVNQALELSRYMEKDSLQSSILLNYGFLHRDLYGFDKLMSYADTAERVAKKYDNNPILAQIDNYRGQIYLQKANNPQKAIQLFRSSLASYKNYDDSPAFDVQNYYGLGDAFSKIDHDSAVAYYEKGVELSLENKMELISMYGRSRIFDILREKEPNSERVNAQSDAILRFQREHPIVDTLDRINYLEILLKENNLRLEEEKHKVRQVVFWAIALLALLSVCIAIYIWNLYRIKRTLSEQLIKVNKQLEDKRQFNEKVIAIMAHDLRQPFASILLAQELVKSNDLDLEECKSLFEQMHIISEQSIQTLDGLLQWTKYNGLGMSLISKKINLKDSIEKAVLFNKYEIDNQDLSLVIDVEDDIDVYGQLEMLLFLNRNIISNAVKYTDKGGEINISSRLLDSASNKVEVIVRDSGRGIDEEVFNGLFYESNTTNFSSNTVKGAGIAMIICQDMIKKMNGILWAENNDDGPGASFYYQLRCS
ncbi:sensor histidine kinase [Olivibacter sitiensis]|uniref:sensor histidine kinase n=1 Tax=Olivibacter sitiensis TaxID=376470 RepID=UPI00146F9823|nr:HAMP domain-containing sensor histidine kinase [Olivibacter sitiensis]